jgi:hypothetical protein
VSDTDSLNESLGQAQLRWAKQQRDLDHVTPVPIENQRDRCSRCGSTDRLRHFWTFDNVFGPRLRSAAALCFDCDHGYKAFGGGQR